MVDDWTKCKSFPLSREELKEQYQEEKRRKITEAKETLFEATEDSYFGTFVVVDLTKDNENQDEDVVIMQEISPRKSKKEKKSKKRTSHMQESDIIDSINLLQNITKSKRFSPERGNCCCS